LEIIGHPYYYLTESPEDAIAEIFGQATDFESIMAEMDAWFPAAIVNEFGDYEYHEDREQLVIFIEDFRQLAEVMSKKDFHKYKPSLSMCKDFRDKYSLISIREQLFNFFFAAVSYDGKIKIDKKSSGFYYLTYLAIAETTHFLSYEKLMSSNV
jgi:hypothetical protein